MLKRSLIIVLALLTAACVPIPAEPPAASPQMTERSYSCAPDHMTLQVGQSSGDQTSDELPGHVDILSVASRLEDETLTAVFHLRNIPQELTVNREGVHHMHQDYGWNVDIDIHGEVRDISADYSLFDYTLRAENSTEKSPSDPLPTTGPFEDVMNPLLLEFVHDTENNYLTHKHLNGNSRLLVSYEDNTLTLSGQIPGITRESTLLFWAYDTLAGQDGIACQSG